MKVVDYLWSLLEADSIEIEDQIAAAEILDGHYALKRTFGVINDPNRDALAKVQAWASHVASSELVPHKLRIRAAKLALAR